MNATDLPPLIRDCVDGQVSPITAGEARSRAALTQGAVRTVRAQRQTRHDVAATGPTAPGRDRRRLSWAGASLTAAAAAMAVGIVSATALAGAPPARQSARQILLTAAGAAAAAAARPGSYWYVRTASVSWLGKTTGQTWTRPDGQTWTSGTMPYNELFTERGKGPRQFSLTGYDWIFAPSRETPISLSPSWDRSKPASWLIFGVVGGPTFALSPRHQAALRNGAGYVTFRQLQQLPASPAALKAWLLAYQRTFTQQTGLHEADPAALIQSLIQLVAGVPAPPQARAAAFRVLATLPNVTRPAPVDGGRALRISLGGNAHATLFVDPETSQAREILTVPYGPSRMVSSVSVSAQWVSQRP